jgi:hypothetical protein
LVRELHYYEGDLVPGGKNWKIPFEFLWENARDGRLKNASTPERQYSSIFYPLARRSRNDYIKSHIECRISVDSEDLEMLSLREAINSIAFKKKLMMDENDVDFNFENVERNVHMACSRLRNVHNEEDLERSGCDQIVQFIIAVLTDLYEKNLLQKLFDQKYTQGRTILQIFVGCEPEISRPNNSECEPEIRRPNNSEYGRCTELLRAALRKMLEILPDVCVNTLDEAGRTVLHWAVAHHSNWAVEELLESRRATAYVTFQTVYTINVTTFQSFLLYEHDLLPFYCPSLADMVSKCFSLHCPARRTSVGIGEWVSDNPLKWTIQMGRNKYVEQVMETEVICPHLCTSLTLTLTCSTV